MGLFKMHDCGQHDSYAYTGCFTVALLQCTCHCCSSHEIITVTASQHHNQVATTGTLQRQDFGGDSVLSKLESLQRVLKDLSMRQNGGVSGELLQLP